MSKKLKVILIGAGDRGEKYSAKMLAMPEKYEVVAVAEPIDCRRERIKERHGLREEFCFADWRPLLSLGKIADLAVIATMDRDHFAPAMACVDLGYDLLLEKPCSPDPCECVKLADAAEARGVRVVVCTVLRYTPLFIKLRELIQSGKIGKVMSINHEECVGNVHQSHSFVRGNWGNEGRSASMLLQKSCHDIDILQWLLGKVCCAVHSFGTLSYFTEENAPNGAPEYCIEGCPVGETCPYNAVKLYYDDKNNAWFRNAATKAVTPTDEDVKRAITQTQYGRCVFRCDNDVVDHQTVNLLFEDDITVTFQMNAFNRGGRWTHIMGTEGEIRAALDGTSPISVYNFVSKETTQIDICGTDGPLGGHGGGDSGIICDLYDYITGNYKGYSIPTIRESCNNHLIVFAAEHARKTHQVVDVAEYIKTLK